MKQLLENKKNLLTSDKTVLVHIPEDFYKKVNYLCTKISEVEWSGVLFYTIKGSLSEGTAEIVCKDILPLNKGTSGYTEFKSDERFVEFLMTRSEEIGEEVFEWQQGLIHSHNSMSVFFSGTDQDELLSSCHLYNQYFSLICNNKMEFCARVARYSEAKVDLKDVSFIGLSTSGEKEVVKKEDLEILKKCTNVYNCNIQVTEHKEKLDSTFTDFAERIMKRSTPTFNNSFTRSNRSVNRNLNHQEEDWFTNSWVNKSSNLFKRDTEEEDLKKLICNFSGAEEYLENLHLDEDSSMLSSISQLLKGFDVPVKEFKLDFIANVRTYCNKNKEIDFKNLLIEIEEFISENCLEHSVYMIELSKEILLTVNTIKNGGRRKIKI